MSAMDRIVLGRIGAAHGIKGEVRLKSFTEPIEAITDYGMLESPDGDRFEFETVRAVKGVLIVRFAGVTDRNAAEALNGIDLTIGRDRLPATDDDEFYHSDLIGLEAVDERGRVYGTVVAVQDFGAGDLLEIAPPRGNGAYLPFTRETVPAIDVAGGRIVIAPPAGLFDGTDEDAVGEGGS